MHSPSFTFSRIQKKGSAGRKKTRSVVETDGEDGDFEGAEAGSDMDEELKVRK